MNKPYISIIIPVYNAEKYLRGTLDSILAQTYTVWECLLIDDGSKDSSGEICDEYVQKDSRFRVFHKANGGVSSARNVGLDNAQGEWITFVDADDWLTPDALEVLYETGLRSVDLVMCKHVMATDSFVPQIANTPASFTQYTHDDAFGRMIDYRLFTGPWAKIYKKELVGDIRFMEGVKIGEDQLFCLEYLLKNKLGVTVCDKMIYFYYQNEQSALHSQKSFRKLYTDLLELIKRFLIDNQLYNRYEAEYHCLKFKLIRQAAMDEKKGYTNEEVNEMKACYNDCKHLLSPYFRHYYLALRMGESWCCLYNGYYQTKLQLKKFLLKAIKGLQKR